MKVLIYGINGKMGKVLVDEVLKDKSLNLVGGISSKPSIYEGITVFKKLEYTLPPDVIIDFSHPSNLKEILDYSITNNVALVLATTGYIDDDFKLITDASRKTPIIYSENYSLGIHAIKKSLKTLLKYLNEFDIEIIEKHHNQKLDKPSGTAYKFIKEINKYKISEIPVHSIRSGNIAGEHTILFSSVDEEIMITHKITSKRVFALGAIRAAKFIVNKNYGLYNMDDLLGG